MRIESSSHFDNNCSALIHFVYNLFQSVGQELCTDLNISVHGIIGGVHTKVTQSAL